MSDDGIDWKMETNAKQLQRSMERNAQLVARIEALEVALRSIASKCPATCDMTLAHEMAQEAEDALGAREREYDPDVEPCDDAEFGMKP